MEPSWSIIRLYIGFGLILLGGGIYTFNYNEPSTWKKTGENIVWIGLLSIYCVFFF